MVKQYYIYPDGHSEQRGFVVTVSPSDYDDPVDRSQFRPDSEETRMFRLTGSGSSGTPLYDGDNIPTDLEVDIRSGKLDKAEISQLQLQHEKEILAESDKKKAEIKKKEKEAISAARQEFLDKSTGFKGSNQSETV